jgi:RNA-directed DNA polymerase
MNIASFKQQALQLKNRFPKHQGRSFFSKYGVCTDFNDRLLESAIQLLATENIGDLRALLKIRHEDLQLAVNEPDYHTFYIAKKRKGKRAIQAPGARLKIVQGRINGYLQAYYRRLCPDAAHGFVLRHYSWPGKGIYSNAYGHVGKEEVLNVDLKDFFNSITIKQVFDLFTGPIFQFPRDLAALLSLLCTYEKRLPVGAPTSPVISNLICLGLDKQLSTFASEHGLHYSRYADDLSFSSAARIPDDLLLDIINIIHGYGFKLNYSKLRRQYPHQRQVVTGLTVNEKVNPDRKMLKQIRAMIHDYARAGHLAAYRHFKAEATVGDPYHDQFIKKLRGLLSFVSSIKGSDDPWVFKYKSQFEAALQQHRHSHDLVE